MPGALASLLGFAAWTLVLVLVPVAYRSAMVLLGRKPANAWKRGEPTAVPPFVERATHAHLNCLETLPVFGAVVLVAAAAGHLPVVDDLAPFVLFARLGQSAVHLVGVTHALVVVRFTFFGAQVALLVAMMARLAAAL